MKDLNTTVTRTHEWRDGELYVIRKHEGQNGDNREVEITTVEKGITPEEVSQVLNEEVPKTIERSDKDIAETEEKINQLKEEVDEDDEKLKEFEEYIESQEVRDLFEKLKKKKEKKQLESQLQQKILDKNDVLDWKNQFEKINEDLQK